MYTSSGLRNVIDANAPPSNLNNLKIGTVSDKHKQLKGVSRLCGVDMMDFCELLDI